MGATITLTTSRDSLVITGMGVFDGPTYDKLEGWYDVATSLRFEKRPSSPGDFAPVRSFADAAPISIEGQYFAPTRADAIAMRERLSGLYDDGLTILMEVADELRTTTRWVSVESVSFEWTAREEIVFAIDVRAPDPRRYGPAQSSSTGLAQPGEGLELPLETPVDFGTAATDGRVTVTNAGNTATVHRVEVSGGEMLDGFVIVNVDTGQRVTYVGPLAAGTSVVVDFDARTAFVNNTAPAGRYLSAPEWWEVPAGSSRTLQLLARGAVTGSPVMTVTTASAYY